MLSKLWHIVVVMTLLGVSFFSMPRITSNPFVAFIIALFIIILSCYLVDLKSDTQNKRGKKSKVGDRRGVVSQFANFSQKSSAQWWEMFLNHPARIMITTFMVLCIFGTAILILPIASLNGSINILDAAFTSVSAVCVTGLIVLDTPKDFSTVGQFFILILIQLGGLGIMSITTVGMHAMGRRLTLRQERLMTTITETDHKDLIKSLAAILKFTFIAEGFGALILSLLFYQIGDSFGQALWRGVFTSISAFCNAGFALQSDSLISYQANPMVLHTVAALIIFGGIAPATTMLIPKLIGGKNIAVAPYIALATTVVLLVAGALFILAFDWNGVLSELSVVNKIHNAWFQSVTLRTAGFNSVDITGVTNPTFIVMIFMMFIGGSPGGTAGGIKTTTIAIIILTFWANITNRKSVIVLNRRVQSRVIYRAITIAVSGALMWCAMVLMVDITQQIPLSDTIFEVTSAMGTVGLSTGATSLLDEIGKVIIMISMFAGRIGPITLFMLLSEDRYDNSSRYQNAKISLT
ncbi:MAG: potassium transporter TrkH [Desulfamplus sp.]|nr:potassium transporter TrkH [Desulfamplus sp.]